MTKKGKTYFSAVVVGSVVEKRVAQQFTEKCKPHDTTEIIEAFINAVVDGKIAIREIAEESKNG